jgi:hypothetical protein
MAAEVADSVFPLSSPDFGPGNQHAKMFRPRRTEVKRGKTPAIFRNDGD